MRASVLVGASVGLLISVGIGYAFYRGSRRLNLGRFFRWTGVLLVFIAAGLVGSAVHEFVEIGWIGLGTQTAFDISATLPHESGIGLFLRALFGYSSTPEIAALATWATYLVVILSLYLRPLPQRPTCARNRPRSRAPESGRGGQPAVGRGTLRQRPPPSTPPAQSRVCMSTNSSSAGARPPKTPAPQQRPPATRQERREAARRDQRLASARTAAVRKPAWQSPMALITAGAVVVGLVVVILASGVLSPKATVGSLIKPLRPTPASLVDPTNPRALGQAERAGHGRGLVGLPVPRLRRVRDHDRARPDRRSTWRPARRASSIATTRSSSTGRATDGESKQAAAAARCAGDKFWSFHDYLFENQNKTARTTAPSPSSFLSAVADAVGADAPRTTPAWRTVPPTWWRR